jgi:hypothetical protein
LVDPALVAWTAGRQVRFLAKAPLFTHPLIGWLVTAVGSVPVYRQQDDPRKVSQNVDSFRDVHRVLASGHVVGIFPEGISHSASRLAPLKTGADELFTYLSRTNPSRVLGDQEPLTVPVPPVERGFWARIKDIVQGSIA